MVKNQNWEKRVESAEARRVAAKERKHRRDSRGAYKALILDLFAALDRHTPRGGGHVVFIHIWTDSVPSDSPPLLDMYQDDGTEASSSSKRRGRSGSINSIAEVKKGRGRCNSMNDESKKKVHPRSKEAASDVFCEEASSVPRLCRKHFFSGKCSGMGKKTACRHVHIPKRYKTLGQVVDDKAKAATPDAIKTLSMSEDAVMDQDDEHNPGSMDMLYYLSIDASSAAPVANEHYEDEGPPSLSDVISKRLADESSGVATIVYLAFDNHFIFDRYRGGVLVPEGELQSILQGGERRLRSISVVSEGGNGEKEEHEGDNISLHSHVLEHILRFLPDEAVASMSRVCRAWHYEIGQDSPELWRFMLERRAWPLPEMDAKTNGADDSPRETFRTFFTRHYSVVRDVEAIRSALGAITNSSRQNVVEEKEMVYQAFSTRRRAPQAPNECIAVRFWSTNQVLIAYSHDCTLRLFKAVDKTADGGNPRGCRELVCVSVDPFSNTRRQQARLVAMDLDEDVIGCLCHVGGGRRQAYMLAVMSRDDFLCADGNGLDSSGATLEEGAMDVIDVGEAVLYYLLTCEDVDHRLVRLNYFLMDGGDLLDVEVLVSQSIQACGYGRFLLEVSIAIPPLDVDDDGDEEMILLDRKLVLFNSTAGAIVWMSDSFPFDLLSRSDEVTISSFRECRPGERRTACSLALTSPGTERILCAELDPTGHMESPRVVETSVVVRTELLTENWRIFHHPSGRVRRRPVVITNSDIVVVDTLFREVNENENVKKSVVSFYPRFASHITYHTLTLEGNCEAVGMEGILDNYVVVLCHLKHETNDPDSGDETGLTADAIVIHVPSRKVIHRVTLFQEDEGLASSTLFASNGDTLGVGLWSKGVVLTGNDIRQVGSNQTVAVEDDLSRSARKQKKKKRQPNKVGKKDGFARGMSLRG